MVTQSKLDSASLEITGDDKTAILFGGSGLVGGYCLRALLTHSTYQKVLALGRSPLKATHPRLSKEIIDFDRPETYRALIKGDDLFICLGTTRAKAGSKAAFRKVDYDYVFQVAKIGALNGVNQLCLVSSVGADPDSAFFYLKVKGQVEQAVSKLPYWSIHIFQPSFLLGKRDENRFGEKIAQKVGQGLDFILGGLISKYRPVEAEVVAKAMVSAAQRLQPGIHIYPSTDLQAMAEEYYQKK